MKKPTKYENKKDDRKNKQVSVRFSEKEYEDICEKAGQVNMTTNQFIRSSCQNSEIIHVTEGRELLATIQDLRDSLHNLPVVFKVDELNDLLSKATLKLFNFKGSNDQSR